VNLPANKASIVTIAADQGGQRIDNFLLNKLKGVPKSHVYRLLRSGQVRVNSGRKKPHYRLQAGDNVRIPPVRTSQRTTPVVPDAQIDRLRDTVLFENEHVLVINKPSGIPVHSGSGYAYGVIDVLRQAEPDATLELVHRLDRETSGCLLLAKSRVSLNLCHTALREQHADSIGKYYLALVAGHWPGSETVAMGIEKVVRSGERMMQTSVDGAAAVSHFECQQSFSHEAIEASLMRVKIDTGRTHQIRVHARYKNHPLAGDQKYGDKSFNAGLKSLGLNRLFLHAAKLELNLPGIGDISTQAALPDDLQNCLDALR
jgi:23S rRNA pseudouridine955/2504/2580 synthase